MKAEGAALLALALSYLSVTPQAGLGFIDYYVLARRPPARRSRARAADARAARSAQHVATRTALASRLAGAARALQQAQAHVRPVPGAPPPRLRRRRDPAAQRAQHCPLRR